MRGIDAATGEVITKILTRPGKQYKPNPNLTAPPWTKSVGPHNTWMNDEGTRVYLGSFTVPFIFIVDTKTNKIIGWVGPFSKGVRPFTVTRDEQVVFANVDGLLGFKVGAARTQRGWGGEMRHWVEAKTPPRRVAQLGKPKKLPHNVPRHGINLRPDHKGVWIVDEFYGHVYVYEVTRMPPKFLQTIPLFARPQDRPTPGWLSFSLDGKLAYPDDGPVIDTRSKQVVTRISLTEKLIEIDFLDDARGVVATDWDFDGDLDLWLANRSAPQVRFLRNDSPVGALPDFVSFQLRGTRCHPDAIGARVEVHLENKKMIKSLRAGEGFLSQSSKWVHFGLGAAEKIEKVVVRWPWSIVETFPDVGVNGHYLLLEGRGAPARREMRDKRPFPDPIDQRTQKEATKIDSGTFLMTPVPMPKLQYRDRQGKIREIHPTSGRKLLINLWAIWCAPCVAELKEFTHRNAELEKKRRDCRRPQC